MQIVHKRHMDVFVSLTFKMHEGLTFPIFEKPLLTSALSQQSNLLDYDARNISPVTKIFLFSKSWQLVEVGWYV